MSTDTPDLRSVPCKCLICVCARPSAATETIDDVQQRGWSFSVVRADSSHPGWVYSVGMRHTARLPDLAVFSIHPEDGAQLIDDLCIAARSSGDFDPGGPIADLRPGLRLAVRPVHRSWFGRELFAMAEMFYQTHRLSMSQVVWSDEAGRFPWEPGADPDARAQPMLWLPRDQHPDSPWHHLDGDLPWPFPDVSPHASAITTRAVLAGETDIVRVRHWPDGTWEFLDDRPFGVEELAVVPMGVLEGSCPGIECFATLPPGQQAWLAGRSWRAAILTPRPERA
jgi:hypothetical protein